MRRWTYLLMGAALLAAGACGQTVSPPKPLKYIPYAHPEMVVKPEELATLADGKAVCIIDLRDAADYRKGHLAGAVHFEWSQLEEPDTGTLRVPSAGAFERMMGRLGLRADLRVLLYDDHRYERAAVLWCLFDYYTESAEQLVGVLNGGWTGIRRLKLATDTKTPQVTSAVFRTRVQEERIIHAEALWRLRRQKDRIRLVDVRSQIEYDGRKIRPPAQHGGHIAGARRMPPNFGIYLKYNAIELCSKVMMHFKLCGVENTHSEQQLKAVIYGHDGRDAAYAVFLARAAGLRDVCWYAGSWIDWSRRYELHEK